MTEAEQYIKDFTRHCSNELVPSGYHEWVTPDNALRACEITKQEVVDNILTWFRANGKNYFQDNQARVLNCMINDLEIKIKETKIL